MSELYTLQDLDKEYRVYSFSVGWSNTDFNDIDELLQKQITHANEYLRYCEREETIIGEYLTYTYILNSSINKVMNERPHLFI